MYFFFFLYPSLSACRLCQSHGRSPEVQGFPPLPFAAIHCRQTPINNAVRDGGTAAVLRHIAPNVASPQQKPAVIPGELILVGGRFTFVRLTLCILDVRIVPLSVQIMKSCDNTLRPLEDCSDGGGQ